MLQQCELVRQAVVLAKEDGNGNKRLVGYVVAQGSLDREGIAGYLKDQLPEYMIPPLLIELQSLPLTPNGKIDRIALPDPDVKELLDKQYVSPSNQVEKTIAEIWEEVLKIEKIGIHDNFFHLGGHSLLILKLVNRVRKMGLQIEVKDFFDYQTIEQQSNFIKTSFMLLNAASEGKFVIPIQKEGNNTPLYAFPEFLLYSGIGKHINKNQPFYTIEQSPYKTVNEVANHYISEIKKIHPHGPYILAGYCNWGKTAVQMAETLIEQGDEVPVLILIEYYSPKLNISRTSLKFILPKMKFIFKNCVIIFLLTKRQNFFQKSSDMP